MGQPGRPRHDDLDGIKKTLTSKLLKVIGSDGKDRMAAIRELRELHGLSNIMDDEVYIPQTHEDQIDCLVRMFRAAGRASVDEALAKAFASHDILPVEADCAESTEEMAGHPPGGDNLA
jgi:hypothetical protein